MKTMTYFFFTAIFLFPLETHCQNSYLNEVFSDQIVLEKPSETNLSITNKKVENIVVGKQLINAEIKLSAFDTASVFSINYHRLSNKPLDLDNPIIGTHNLSSIVVNKNNLSTYSMDYSSTRSFGMFDFLFVIGGSVLTLYLIDPKTDTGVALVSLGSLVLFVYIDALLFF